MFATNPTQALLHAQAAADIPDVVLTDGLEGEIESALAAGWHPRRRRRRAAASRRLCHRRGRPTDSYDEAMFRP